MARTVFALFPAWYDLSNRHFVPTVGPVSVCWFHVMHLVVNFYQAACLSALSCFRV